MDHGIILGFQQKVWFDLCFTSQIPLVQENMCFQIIVYLQSSIMPKGGKASIPLRFPFVEAFYFFDTKHLALESKLEWGEGRQPSGRSEEWREMVAGAPPLLTLGDLGN